MLKSNFRVIYLSFCCCCLMVAGLFFFYQLSSLTFGGSTYESTNVTLYEVNAKEYNANGKLTRQLKSPAITHQIKTNNNVITNPKINVVNNNVPWLIKADSATTVNQNEKIILKGHVIITQYQNGKVISQLKTKQLTYFPATQKMITNENITYKNKGITVQAKGLIGNLQQETIELVSNARGKYVQQKS